MGKFIVTINIIFAWKAANANALSLDQYPMNSEESKDTKGWLSLQVGPTHINLMSWSQGYPEIRESSILLCQKMFLGNNKQVSQIFLQNIN